MQFAFDGMVYEIDLTEKEKLKFARVLDQCIAAGQKVSTRRSTKAASSATGYDAESVRAWAPENKIDVPARGRISASLLEAYDAAR